MPAASGNGDDARPPDRHLYALIMAGGGGTRFWPLSRQRLPKQFLSIAGERSLLQTTWERALDAVGDPERALVITATDYEELTREQLDELPVDNLLLEPQARNTAPCIAWSSAVIRARDPEAVELVLPADHLIADREAFARAVATATATARRHRALTTFGVTPRYPETGYGYVEAGRPLELDDPAAGEVFGVRRFREKPDLQTARQYLAAGNFFWNSGIFAWTAADIWEALRTHLPDACRGAEAMLAATDDHSRAEAYAMMPATSIDFGVMERAANVATVKADFDWSDVGSWAALKEVCDAADDAGNVTFGSLLQVDAGGNLVHSPEALVALLGVDDLAVVNTGDVVLVASLERSQDVKLLRERLTALGLDHLL